MKTIKINQVQYGRYAVTPTLHKNAFYKVFFTKGVQIKTNGINHY